MQYKRGFYEGFPYSVLHSAWQKVYGKTQENKNERFPIGSEDYGYLLEIIRREQFPYDLKSRRRICGSEKYPTETNEMESKHH